MVNSHLVEPKLGFMQELLEAYRQAGLDFNVPVAGSPTGAWMVVNGKRVLNFCSNNYLGLANHPALKEAARKALDRWGVGAGAVRFFAGTQELHLELERRLAEFKGTEAAMYTQTGFVANLCGVTALVDSQDVVFSDALNHASIIDGARLSRARIVVYEHCRMADLRAKVEEHLPHHRRGLVITDGVFSMDGDLAPLDEIAALAEKYELLTLVDDAHGEGVLGNGRGIVHHFGLEGKIDVEVGTLSKAFGVIGGVVAGKQLVVDYVRAQGRAQNYSTATTPPDTAACLAAVNLLSDSTELVDKLWANTTYFTAGLSKLGFDTGITQTPIVPILLGEVGLARQFSARLFEEGVFAVGLGYPIVPRGTARVRIMNTAAHSREDLDFALAAFEAVGRELGVVGRRRSDG
jgi:glycine C-acetyltransferase